MQAKRKNMARMEEAVVEADEQRLQHMLTDSDWDHRAVLDQVAREADEWLGGTDVRAKWTTAKSVFSGPWARGIWRP